MLQNYLKRVVYNIVIFLKIHFADLDDNQCISNLENEMEERLL